MISFSEGDPSGGATDYEVSFNPNGGYLDTDDPNGYYKPVTSTGRLYIPDSGFTQGNYYYDFLHPAGEFSSWNTRADGLGTTCNPGSLINVTSNVTLYAIWSPNQYTLTLEDDVKETVSIDIHYGATLSTGPLNYTKSGYTHVGWSTAPPTRTGNVYVTAQGADFYPLDIVYDKTEDMTLYPVYALYRNIGSGNITINDNGYHHIVKTSGNVSSSRTLLITGGSPSVILDNVVMTSNSSGVSPIKISSGATLNLTLWGTNTLKGIPVQRSG